VQSPLEPGRLYLTDGGLETSLIFHQGLELREFAAFDLLCGPDGHDALATYFAPYVAAARERGLGMVVDTATWRANPDWAAALGFSSWALAELNGRAVDLAREVASGLDGLPAVVDGVVGPRGDGYVVENAMSSEQAADYHAAQIAVLARDGVDLVSAITMNYAEEGVGVATAAAAAGVPTVISFTVETDGRLPTGQPLHEAVEQVDAETSGHAPAYFMVNCAHPTHFAQALEVDGPWRQRIGGLRANASRMSHAELDAAEELDDGDPAELGEQHAALRDLLPGVQVLGGCCGTDARHVAAVVDAWAP
jgi:S-methylmethionine-dependent homocysteine/selenocysteine methylase